MNFCNKRGETMTNILSIPEEISGYISFFQNVYSKPQFCRFTDHILSRIVDIKYSNNRIPNHFFHKVNQSTENRFLTESPWKNEKVESRLYDLVEGSGILPNFRIGLLDDTLAHKKYAKKMDGVGNHKDHLNNTFSNGHDVVTIGTYTKYGCLPLASKPYVKKKDAKKGIVFKTKNQIAENSVKQIYKHISLNLMVMDSWYGNNAGLLLYFRGLGMKFVAAIKSNRNITFRRKKQYVREYFAKLKKKDFEIFIETKDGEPKDKYRVHKVNVFISKLGNIDLLISQQWNSDEKKWTDPYYIITDLENKSAIEILCLYLKRSSIEGFHREAKQNLSMERYMVRGYKGIVRHLFLVVVAYVFLMLMMNELNMESTIGKMCEYVRKCCETVSFHTVINTDTNIIFQEDIRENLGLVA
jgi:SRSO17 transposase